jgi:predicted CopG family antitoxin
MNLRVIKVEDHIWEQLSIHKIKTRSKSISETISQLFNNPTTKKEDNYIDLSPETIHQLSKIKELEEKQSDEKISLKDTINICIDSYNSVNEPEPT